MKLDAVEKIAEAVLYEGYILYPYRPSATKNRQRFNFGVLYPRDYCDQQLGTEAWEMKTECLVLGGGSTLIECKVRFLQLIEFRGWQEGIDRATTAPACSLFSLAAQPYRQSFSFGPLKDTNRSSETLDGEFELRAVELDNEIFRVSLAIRNLSHSELGGDSSRDSTLLHSLVSVHSILHAANGEFISMIDPPDQLKAAAAACRNVGTWPVLVGEQGQRDLILSAPIILYDYPQIAPESAGDLFDGTEIDEILALRILTMTDEEKREVRNGDSRARQILERTEALPPEHFQKLHGTLRNLRTNSTESRS